MNCVADPHHFDADPDSDPNCHFEPEPDPDRDPTFRFDVALLIRIPIQIPASK